MDIKPPVNYDLLSGIIACHPHFDRQFSGFAAVIKIIQKEGQNSVNMNPNSARKSCISTN